jgi:MFS family permease
MADPVLTPAMDKIYASFPDTGVRLLDLFLTGPMFTSVMGTLFCGFMAQRVSKKTLLVGAYILFPITAGGGALVANMHYMASMRLLSGFAMGVALTATMGLIAELFGGEAERSRMMGGLNSMSAVVGGALSLLGGYLATGDWHRPFYLYLLSVPVLVLILAVIPKTPPEGRKSHSENRAATKKLPIRKIAPIAIAFTVYGALYFVSLYYLSFYLEETHLGDARTAGVISSVGMASGFIAGIAFIFIYMRVKKATPAVCIFLTATAYFMMAFPADVRIVTVAYFACSFAYITLNSYYFMRASMIVPRSVISMTMGILSAVMCIGGFLSSYLFDAYHAILHLDTITGIYFYIGVTLAAGGVVSVVLAIRAKKHPDVVERESVAEESMVGALK